jgi:hypothetical protein
MKIVIVIPPEMEDVATKLDVYLKTLHGNPVMQESGDLLQAKMFPNGIGDWARLVFKNNFQQEAMKISDQIPSLRDLIKGVSDKQKEVDASFQLTTSVEE